MVVKKGMERKEQIEKRLDDKSSRASDRSDPMSGEGTRRGEGIHVASRLIRHP